MKAINFALAQAAGDAAAAPAVTAAPAAAPAAEIQTVTTQPAAVPGDPATQPKPGMMDGLMGMLPFILVIVVMFYLMSRSQKKEQKRRQEMLAALKKGDEVLTAGGIFGKVAEIKEDRIFIEIADNVKISVTQNAISTVKAPNAEDVKK